MRRIEAVLHFSSCSTSLPTVHNIWTAFRVWISVDQVFGCSPWSLFSHSRSISWQHLTKSLLYFSSIASIIETSNSRKSATVFHSDEIFGITMLCSSFILGTTSLQNINTYPSDHIAWLPWFVIHCGVIIVPACTDWPEDKLKNIYNY